MRISVAADERTGVAEAVVEELRRRGHEPLVHGALTTASATTGPGPARPPPATWPRAAPSRPSSAAGRAPARRSRRTRCRASAPRSATTPRPRAARASWNDANVLALSLRTHQRGAAERDPRRLVRGARRATNARRRGEHPPRRRDRASAGRRSRAGRAGLASSGRVDGRERPRRRCSRAIAAKVPGTPSTA